MSGVSLYMAKWVATMILLGGRMVDYPLFKHVEVETCGPLKNEMPSGKQEVDFDDPNIAFPATADWATSTRTKLRAQVTLNFRLVIPFANLMIHRIFTNMGTNPVLRLGKNGKDLGGPRNLKYLVPAFAAGIYVIPIRATYTMRMQSNIYTAELPSGANPCVFSFGY